MVISWINTFGIFLSKLINDLNSLLKSCFDLSFKELSSCKNHSKNKFDSFVNLSHHKSPNYN